MHIQYIENRKGSKVKWTRYIVGSRCGRLAADGARFETAQAKRRRNAREYRRTHGRAMLWPLLTAPAMRAWELDAYEPRSKSEILGYYGPRCASHDADCPTCQAYAVLDATGAFPAVQA